MARASVYGKRAWSGWRARTAEGGGGVQERFFEADDAIWVATFFKFDRDVIGRTVELVRVRYRERSEFEPCQTNGDIDFQ